MSVETLGGDDKENEDPLAPPLRLNIMRPQRDLLGELDYNEQ